jgi:hypothetical protein
MKLNHVLLGIVGFLAFLLATRGIDLAQARTGETAPLATVTGSALCIDDGTLDAASNTCTVTLADKGFAKGQLFIDFDYTDGSSISLTVTPWCSNDGGTTYFRYTSRAISAGAGTLSLFADTLATGDADIKFMVEYDVRACDSVQFVITDANGSSNESIDVDFVGVIGD